MRLIAYRRLICTGLRRACAGIYLVLGVGSGPMLLMAFAQYSSNVQANTASVAGLSDIPSVRWSAEQRVFLSGVPMSLWTFDSHAPLIDIVQSLAKHTSHFQRVLVQDGVLVLSGLGQGRHWLAEVSPTARGTTGRLSSLSGDGLMSAQDTTFSAAEPYPRWRPSWATVLFSIEATQRGEPTMALLRVPGSINTVRYNVGVHLRAQSWVASLEPGMFDTWLNEETRLRLFFDCVGGACTVLGYLQPLAGR